MRANLSAPCSVDSRLPGTCQMKALIYDGSLRFLSEYPEPRRRKGESLIRVKLAGICNTDLEIARGYMGYTGVLGHEFVGYVEESDTEELQGKRVVGEINLACGKCKSCDSGLSMHCPNRTVLGIMDHPGAMAELCTLPDSNLHVVPEDLPDEAAVFCEPLAAAFEILTQVSIESGQDAIVLGDGKLGLLVAQVLKNAGAKVLLTGHSTERLALARSWNITTSISGDITKELVDVVVDCTGSADGLETAMRLIKPRGTIVMKTTVSDKYSVNLAPLVINEVTLVGSRCGPFKPALEALADGTVSVTDMITRIFPMEQALEAFEFASRPEALKVIIGL